MLPNLSAHDQKETASLKMHAAQSTSVLQKWLRKSERGIIFHFLLKRDYFAFFVKEGLFCIFLLKWDYFAFFLLKRDYFAFFCWRGIILLSDLPSLNMLLKIAVKDKSLPWPIEKVGFIHLTRDDTKYWLTIFSWISKQRG